MFQVKHNFFRSVKRFCIKKELTILGMKWWLGCPSPTTQYVDALISKAEVLCMLCSSVQHNRISAPCSEPLGVSGN